MSSRALIRRSLAAFVGLVLIADGVWLMLQDKTNFGTVLPTVIGMALCLWAWQQIRLQAYLLRSRMLSLAWQVFVIGFGVWVASLLFYIFSFSAEHAGHYDRIEPPTAIVVLGSGLLNSVPTPTLQERLNVAVIQAAQYPKLPILTAGGLGKHQTITEAQAMANYLIARGVAPQRIILENRSASTYENMQFAKLLLPTDAKVLLVTSDFHMSRSQAIARKAGVVVVRHASAPTPQNIRYNAWLREYFACISGWLLSEY
jgi:uncharacterized SAM-binding protein YcdF (DUF218 family)